MVLKMYWNLLGNLVEWIFIACSPLNSQKTQGLGIASNLWHKHLTCHYYGPKKKENQPVSPKVSVAVKPNGFLWIHWNDWGISVEVLNYEAAEGRTGFAP